MDTTSDGRRVVGALRLLAELSAMASECAATGVWDDELTARRRQREEPRAAESQEQQRVKIL